MQILGITAAILSAGSWALGTLLFDRIGRHIPPAGITFIKGAMSIVLMALVTFFFTGVTTAGTTECIYLAISGIIGIAIGDTLFFKSLSDLGPKVQVLYFLLGQVLTMALSFVFLGEVLTLTEYIGAVILLSGILIVIWGKQENNANKRRGVILGFLSILCFSVSAIIVKVAIPNIDVVSATFYRMTFGTMFILFVGVTAMDIRSWIKPLRDVRLLGLFVLNVFIITFGGFMLSMVAIKYTTVTVASVLSATEPVFVLIFAYLLNRDLASRREVTGAVITIMGLLVIILYDKISF